MSQRNPDTNTSLEQLRNARDKPIALQQAGNIPMAPRNMQLQSKMSTGTQNSIPARTFDMNVPAARMPMPPSQGMPMPPSQGMPMGQSSTMTMQPKISEEQMRNALKAQETNRKQQTVNLINNQQKVNPQIQRVAQPQKTVEMPLNIPKMPESVRSAMNVAMDNQQINDQELSLFDKIKKDAKVAIIIFAVAFIISYPAVSNLIGKYIPGMINSEENITIIGQIILAAIIAVISVVAKHFVQ